MFETRIDPTWQKAAEQRCAVRRYTGAPTPEQLKRLGDFSRQISYQGVRVLLMQGPGLPGSISGTNVYAAVIGSKAAPVELEGYVGEAMVLEATGMGLGSCWLGMYNKAAVKAAIKLTPEESIHCVLALGQCAPQTPQHKRKPLSKTSGLSDAEIAALPAWQQSALRCAAIAPSAVNWQQWKFVVSPNQIDVVDVVNMFGYGAIDRGIAMLHIAAGALASGAKGTWKQSEKGWAFRA